MNGYQLPAQEYDSNVKEGGERRTLVSLEQERAWCLKGLQLGLILRESSHEYPKGGLMSSYISQWLICQL